MLLNSRMVRTVTLVLIFGLAFAIRLYDLTDLPLDFHPTRQLLSAMKARALYYQTQPDGIPTWQLQAGIELSKLKADVEPVIFERLVAFTYHFTGEQVWVARIYSSLFWMIGGVFLFLLARELVSFEGALFAAAYYLLFPYGVIGSRSFQPDPLMVMLILSFWWTFLRWVRSSAWHYALLAGLLGGFAILIKFSAAFFIIGAALGLGLSRFTLRELLRNAQVWGMAVLGAIPALAYLYYGVFILGSLGSQFSGRFFPQLLISPLNYLQWATKVDLAAGGLFITLGLLGLFLIKEQRMRGLMTGLWGAYLLYGLIFNYHVATHDYYHLPLIPIVALSLAPLGDWVTARWSETTQGHARSVVYIILLYGLFSVVWSIRNQMKAVDYRPEAGMWAEIGEKLAHEPTAMALIPDYGSRLEYYGLTSAGIWPSVGELAHKELRSGPRSSEGVFEKWVRNKSYFLITDFAELKRQPELKARLLGYPVYAEGEGYIIYQLRDRK